MLPVELIYLIFMRLEFGTNVLCHSVCRAWNVSLARKCLASRKSQVFGETYCGHIVDVCDPLTPQQSSSVFTRLQLSPITASWLMTGARGLAPESS
ncbi:hypothetical protein WJX73_006641 [Symbiochloris irregularis]|uniref:F-box domain-containing protein n=1 Tax=Symbiochloris irregularis TaxID=706552 RepID=A0AAW1PIE9_9CHLO